MEITRVDPDDATELAAWVDLVNTVAHHDAPWEFPETLAGAAGRMRYGWDLEPSIHFLARADGAVVGRGSIATSEYDNLHLAWLDVAVHPDHRCRGIGTAILHRMEEEARAAGRTSVGINAWESDAGRGFAARHGYDLKHRAINRRQRLADVDWAELDKRYDEGRPHAAAYALERWTMPTPDAELDALTLMTASINDAPTDDLDIEDEVFTAERTRAYETANLARPQRMYRVVARHTGTGELAGHTVVAVDREQPDTGHQHDTSVLEAHRGHRLGLLLKAEMLRWLREEEPQLAEVDTWNAESNDHMIGVNELLGYRVMGRELAFQRSLI